MKDLIDAVEDHVRQNESITADEVSEDLNLPLAVVRNALAQLAPVPPETKKKPPRAGSLVVDGEGRWTVGTPPPPPEPPPPEPRRCPMTEDGAHIPSINPLYSKLCTACSHEIGPKDPIRKGYKRPVASVPPAR